MQEIRAKDLRAAARLCSLTVLWNVLAGGAAIATAVAVGSLSLVGFGINSALDSVASAALVWRFRAEESNAHRAARLEELTVRIVGVTLVAVTVYLAARAIASLRTGSGPNTSAASLTITALSALVLPPLAYGKLRLASRLRSRALRGDGVLTTIGAALALLALTGLGLSSMLGWSWTDAAAALLMSVLLLREAHLTLRPSG